MSGSFLYVYAASGVFFLMTLGASGIAEAHTFYAWLAATTASFFPLAWVETVRIRHEPTNATRQRTRRCPESRAIVQLSPPSEDREKTSQALR